MIDSKKFTRDVFKAAQSPQLWLLSASRLRDGAEAILEKELKYELPYIRAHKQAFGQATANAYSDRNDAGTAEIKARVPNYPVAEMLYGYALENLLKGIIVANDPLLISDEKFNAKLKSHDLIQLSKTCEFALNPQEIHVAKALSKLTEWAGRYPVALRQNEFAAGIPSRDELLDYGSQHPTMRMLFNRCYSELERLLPKAIGSQYGVVVVFK